MKSVIAQGATIAKAIEEALKKADMPQEFFVKLLEDAQGGFLGFGAKKAKIALFFKPDVASGKHDSLMDRNAYENLFNNPTMRKQIEQQLKEIGLEIQPIAPKKQQQPQSPAPKKVEQAPVKQPAQANSVRSMQQRQLPVQNTSKQQSRYDVRPQQDDTHSSDENQSQYRRPRRSRYFRPRHRYNRSNNDSGGSSESGGSGSTSAD